MSEKNKLDVLKTLESGADENTYIKHHRFPIPVIACAVRKYLLSGMTYREVSQWLLEKKGINVSHKTIYMWVHML